MNEVKQIIDEDLVRLDMTASSCDEAIACLAGLMEAGGRLYDKERYLQTVRSREALCPTCVGFHVAIPHGKCLSVKTPSVAFARLRQGIRWGDEEVQLIFLLAVPEAEAGNRHLEILAMLSRKLMHEEFRDQLQALRSAREVVSLVSLDNRTS